MRTYELTHTNRERPWKLTIFLNHEKIGHRYYGEQDNAKADGIDWENLGIPLYR